MSLSCSFIKLGNALVFSFYSLIPNGLGKYMAFTTEKHLVFIDSMQFINSSLDALVKNLSDNNLEYSSQEFSGVSVWIHGQFWNVLWR